MASERRWLQGDDWVDDALGRFAWPGVAALLLLVDPMQEDRTAGTENRAEAEDGKARRFGKVINFAALRGIAKNEVGNRFRAA